MRYRYLVQINRFEKPCLDTFPPPPTKKLEFESWDGRVEWSNVSRDRDVSESLDSGGANRGFYGGKKVDARNSTGFNHSRWTLR